MKNSGLSTTLKWLTVLPARDFPTAEQAAGPRASGDAVRDAEGVHAHAGMQQSATLQECDREVEGLGHANVEGATREDEPHVDAMRRGRR